MRPGAKKAVLRDVLYLWSLGNLRLIALERIVGWLSKF